MADNKVRDDGATRNYLAEIFGVGGFLVILVVAGLVIWRKPEDAQHVLNVILPLIASWVGTVIAYYFSKENLAAATASVATLAEGMVDLRRLQTIPVTQKMIPKASIGTLPTTMTDPFTALDAVLLKDIITFAGKAAKPITRLPILRPEGTLAYMLHVSVINQFVAAAAVAGNANAAALAFKDLIGDAQVKQLATGSFAVVASSATLAQAKTAMDQTPHCEDVFVTEDGSPTKPVLGWLTDDAIWSAARV